VEQIAEDGGLEWSLIALAGSRGSCLPAIKQGDMTGFHPTPIKAAYAD